VDLLIFSINLAPGRTLPLEAVPVAIFNWCLKIDSELISVAVNIFEMLGNIDIKRLASALLYAVSVAVVVNLGGEQKNKRS